MTTNTPEIATVPLEMQTSVELLEGITPNEVEKLKAQKIFGLNDLWTAIGGDKLELSKIESLASRTKISSDRLVELLPAPLIDLLYAELLRRADDLSLDVSGASSGAKPSRKGIWRQVSLAAKNFGPWLRRHLVDLILIGGVLALALVVVRATGLLDNSSLGLYPTVVITRRDLKTGTVVRIHRDLSYARFPLKENYFASTSALDGLILKRDVSAQKPLRWDDLLRFQVVATRDIAADEMIPADAVKLDWSTYDPTAMVRLDDVKNHKNRYAIRKDNVITQTAILP
jgi:hypothetical protein